MFPFLPTIARRRFRRLGLKGQSADLAQGMQPLPLLPASIIRAGLYELPNGVRPGRRGKYDRQSQKAERRPAGLGAGLVPVMGAREPRRPARNGRITLLRDADGDGVAETKTVFIDDLNSPPGMALVGDHSMSRTPMR